MGKPTSVPGVPAVSEGNGEGYTTIPDVIEECLGEELAPANMKFFQSLTHAQLRDLRDGLKEHSLAEYLRFPAMDGNSMCALFHPGGRVSRSLGSVPGGVGHRIDAPPGDMNGSLYLALTYFPRVAMKDGLEYFLDYYDSEDRRFANSINNILGFYCLARELIRREDLIVMPRTVWQAVAAEGIQGPELYQGKIEQTLRMVSEPLDIARKLEDEKPPIDESFTEDDFRRASLAEIRGVNNRVRELNLLGALLNYTPILESRDEQRFWKAQSLMNDPFTEYMDAAGTISATALVRNFSRISYRDFSALRNAGGFARFRETIDGIAGELEQQPGSANEEEMINDLLAQAQDEVVREIDSSATLRKVFTGSVHIGFDAIRERVGGRPWTEIAFSRAFDTIREVGGPLYRLYERTRNLGPVSRVLKGMILPDDREDEEE